MASANSQQDQTLPPLQQDQTLPLLQQPCVLLLTDCSLPLALALTAQPTIAHQLHVLLTSTLTSECAEHDSSPTRRVNAARAAAAWANRPIQVIPLPANYQRSQSGSRSGGQAQGSQAPGHPFRGRGRARGHKGRRAGHGNGPAATCGMYLCLSVCLSVCCETMHAQEIG